jgi:hypothetical protein
VNPEPAINKFCVPLFPCPGPSADSFSNREAKPPLRGAHGASGGSQHSLETHEGMVGQSDTPDIEAAS